MRLRLGRKIVGGFCGGGVDGQHLIELRHFQNALDHSMHSGKMQGSSGSFQAAEAFDDLPDHGAIDMVHAGQIEDYAIFILLDVAFDFAVKQGAVVAHGDSPRDFEQDDARLDLPRG
jgi:hypothetical protein